MTLPDCRHHEDPFALTAEDRRELVRRIAEQGAGAIDAFVKEREAQGDGTIAKRVQKLREELLRRADELRRKLAEGFASREEAMRAEYDARLAQLQQEREAVASGMQRLSLSDASLVEAAARGDPILAIALAGDRQARVPWWRVALRWLVKLVRILLWPLRWLWTKLVGTKPAKRQDRALFAVPGAAGSTLLDRAGGLYLSDAKFRGAVKARLRAAPTSERVRRAWERLLGLEDYESLARKAMAQMLQEDAERALQQERATMEQKLSELVERERAAAQQRATTEQQLAREREAEERALENALRSMPEQQVKEAIVDELQAAGLLRSTSEGLAPTLQLMDRFAALVYEDETMSAGGRGRQGAGEYAEGEGHYVRGPMQSAIETSRMDVLATVIRARSRHPKVRHMFDEDVVVHREERTSAMHVVLIVDRSGSMEDNNRMDAAKRATLALHHAVRARNVRNRVDVLLMDTSVRAATLRDVWETEPTGFTNHGAALRMAREMARRRRSERLLVYLVTDGLPEAYTKEGEDVAGHPDRAMAYAKDQAQLLRRERALAGFVMLLLEPENERHVKAANDLAKEAGGRVQAVDPNDLVATLVGQFEGPQTPLA